MACVNLKMQWRIQDFQEGAPTPRGGGVVTKAFLATYVTVKIGLGYAPVSGAALWLQAGKHQLLYLTIGIAWSVTSNASS